VFKKSIEVTECIYIRKIVDIKLPRPDTPADNLESHAIVAALHNTPDYREAGWDLVGSDGFTFREITTQNR
jgi:hypothetical protein